MVRFWFFALFEAVITPEESSESHLPPQVTRLLLSAHGDFLFSASDDCTVRCGILPRQYTLQTEAVSSSLLACLLAGWLANAQQ